MAVEDGLESMCLEAGARSGEPLVGRKRAGATGYREKEIALAYHHWLTFIECLLYTRNSLFQVLCIY